MAEHSKIEYTDATWNPITGCSVASPGCTNCYAMRLAGTRLKHHHSRAGLTKDSKAGPVWTGKVRLNEEWLTQPLRWKRQRMIFVCAHGDLFHESVPDEWIDRVFAVMALDPQHTFQVLTKRARRMREYFSDIDMRSKRIAQAFLDFMISGAIREHLHDENYPLMSGQPDDEPRLASLPLPNVWLGVSVEDQARADERIPDLLATSAAVRWISAEPLLEKVDLSRIQIVPPVKGSPRAGIHIDALRGRYAESGMPYIGDWDIDGPYPKDAPALKLDWIIAGGESGPGARPMHPDWARSLREQCAAAGVPFHFKQWGEWLPRSQWEFNPDLILPDDECVEWANSSTLINTTNETFHFIGKCRAGRLLDGIEHNGMPRAAAKQINKGEKR